MRRVSTPRGSGITSVRLERASGPIDLVRPGDAVATLSQAGQPDRRISLPRRDLPECLADELRRLDPDNTYEDALLHGVERLTPARQSATAAAKTGKAPDVAAARRLAARIGRAESAQGGSAMVAAAPAPEGGSSDEVRAATARKLAGKRTPREKVTDAAATSVSKKTAEPEKTAKKTAAKSTAKKATT